MPKEGGVSAEFTCIERLVDGESASDEADNGLGLGCQDGVRSILLTYAGAWAILVDEENDEQTLDLEADKPRRRSHKNAPLTPEGRNRLIERCRTRPIAHVAAEMGISRATASKWVNHYRRFGEIGLLDRSSAPLRRPTAIPGDAVARIEQLRREHK